jgi:hypothetical protein
VAVADPWDPAYAVPGERTEEATSVVPLPGNGGPGGGRVGGGSAAGGGGRATPRVQRPALDPGTKFGAKIEGQLRARGWTKRLVESTIRNPARIVKTRDIRAVEGGGRMNDPATVYYSARGGYVVRNNRTGDIVQISNRLNPNWRAPWDR